MGYTAIFSFIIHKSDKELVQRLDQSRYDHADLVQIKIPMNLPYYNSQSDFERIDGEITYKGVYYSYVKRKVANDTLYIMCLPNQAKTKLHGAQTDYAKKSNDLPFEKQNTTGKKSGAISEHNAQLNEYSFAIAAQPDQQSSFLFASRLYSTFPNSNFQPPEVNAWTFSIPQFNRIRQLADNV